MAGTGTNSFFNTNTWTTTGNNSFAGTSTFTNSGLMNVSGTTTMQGLQTFNNGTNSATGIINFGNSVGSALTTTGNFISSPGSELIVAGNLNQGTVDKLVVGGTASGTITVVGNGITGNLGTPVPVIVTNPNSNLQIKTVNLPANIGVAQISPGVFDLISTSSQAVTATVNAAAARVSQLTGFAVTQQMQQVRDQIQRRGHEATEAAGFNAPLGYADDGILGYANAQRQSAMFTKAPPAAAPPQASNLGIWLTGFDDVNRRSDPGFDHTTYTGGVLGGFDKTWFNLLGSNDALVAGVVSDYSNSDVRYVGSDLRVNFHGGGIGAYATYVNGNFSVDTVLKADFFDVSDSASNQVSNSVGLDNYTVSGNTQYKFYIMKSSAFFEPTAGFVYTNSQYGTATVPGVFNDGYDWRVQGGARFGGASFAWNNVTFSPTIQALAYSDVKITGTTLQAIGVQAPIDEGLVRGQFDGTLNMDFGHGLTANLTGELRVGEDLLGYAVKGGLRYTW